MAADQGSTVTDDPQQAEDGSVRTQTIVWPASTFVTTWTLGTGSDTTESPGTVVPAQDSSSTSNQNVGPILSGIVVLLVLILVFWVCYRRSSSYSSGTSSGSSRNDASVGSATSEVAEQWDQQAPVSGQPMPGMPPPVAGGWPAQQPGNGMGHAVPPNMGMGFPPGRGGPPPMMGQGLPGRGGPPPIMGGGGGYPPGVMQ
ncbi:hypothetical protein Daesc_005760 [Daldinia eschscholtzii]|uniref:Uncharacterized protein n=1 Tax=Daldinia eschscholtzii TaxID=292717 RepID=A0AAX6MLV1_9PEZI